MKRMLLIIKLNAFLILLVVKLPAEAQEYPPFVSAHVADEGHFIPVDWDESSRTGLGASITLLNYPTLYNVYVRTGEYFIEGARIEIEDLPPLPYSPEKRVDYVFPLLKLYYEPPEERNPLKTDPSATLVVETSYSEKPVIELPLFIPKMGLNLNSVVSNEEGWFGVDHATYKRYGINEYIYAYDIIIGIIAPDNSLWVFRTNRLSALEPFTGLATAPRIARHEHAEPILNAGEGWHPEEPNELLKFDIPPNAPKGEYAFFGILFELYPPPGSGISIGAMADYTRSTPFTVE